MISAVVSARLAGLDRIKSGFTSRFANRLPIFGASRLPRSFNGRSLSGNAVYSQLDFAWRTRNSVFISLRRLGSASCPDAVVPHLRPCLLVLRANYPKAVVLDFNTALNPIEVGRVSARQRAAAPDRQPAYLGQPAPHETDRPRSPSA